MQPCGNSCWDVAWLHWLYALQTLVSQTAHIFFFFALELFWFSFFPLAQNHLAHWAICVIRFQSRGVGGKQQHFHWKSLLLVSKAGIVSKIVLWRRGASVGSFCPTSNNVMCHMENLLIVYGGVLALPNAVELMSNLAVCIILSLPPTPVLTASLKDPFWQY